MLGLAGAPLAWVPCGTIRLNLFKRGVRIRVSVPAAYDEALLEGGVCSDRSWRTFRTHVSAASCGPPGHR